MLLGFPNSKEKSPRKKHGAKHTKIVCAGTNMETREKAPLGVHCGAPTLRHTTAGWDEEAPLHKQHFVQCVLGREFDGKQHRVKWSVFNWQINNMVRFSETTNILEKGERSK